LQTIIFIQKTILCQQKSSSLQETSGTDKIIRPRPDCENQRSPQKQIADDLYIEAQKPKVDH